MAVLSLFISPDELSKDELQRLVTKSYATFRDPVVTPLKKLDERRYVLELWHGPTWAFKDVALQLLGNLFEFFLERRNAKKGDVPQAEREKLTVVGATSGDTGRCVSIPHATHQVFSDTFSCIVLLSTVYETKQTCPSSSCILKGAFPLYKKPK